MASINWPTVVVSVALTTALLIVGALFWAGVLSLRTSCPIVNSSTIIANKTLEDRFKTASWFGDYVLIKNAEVDEAMVRDLKRSYLKDDESIVSATKNLDNFYEHLNERDIEKITVWKVSTGFKAKLISYDGERMQFLKGDIIKREVKQKTFKSTMVVDLKNMTIYADETVNITNSSDYETFHFFYGCEDTLFGFKKMYQSLENFTIMLSLKKNAEFLEMSGRLGAYFNESNATSVYNRRNISQDKVIKEFKTSWAEFFRSTKTVTFSNKARSSVITVEDGRMATLYTPYATHFLNGYETMITMLTHPYTYYNCKPIGEDTIEISWPLKRVRVEMFEMKSIAILYLERKTLTSYLKLADDLTTERFQFEPAKNLISMQNLRGGMENSRNRSVVRIWEAKNKEIRVNYSEISITCYDNNLKFTISRDTLTVKAGNDQIVMNKSNIVFWRNGAQCVKTISLQKLNNTESKVNETCEQFNDSSVKLFPAHHIWLRAVHGNATLTLLLENNSLWLETPVGSATRYPDETVLNCGWASARIARELFPFQIWEVKDGVLSAMKGESRTIYSPLDDFIILESDRTDFLISRLGTEINTFHSKIIIENN